MNTACNRSQAIAAKHHNVHQQWCLITFLIVAVAISLPVAAQSWQVPQPSTGLMPNPAAGEALYEKSCAVCHGADLQGSDKGPPMPSKIDEPSHHCDAAFQLAAKSGSRALLTVRRHGAGPRPDPGRCGADHRLRAARATQDRHPLA